jgi:hypothetical protein
MTVQIRVTLGGMLLLPEFIIKPFKHGNRILHVFLSLLPPVENRAISTRAQHILESSCHPPGLSDQSDPFLPDEETPDIVDTASTVLRILPEFLRLKLPTVR